MKKPFGVRSDGQQTYLYTIQGGGLTAVFTDHGATLVRLFVPDDHGVLADVVLGFDHPDDYTNSTTYFGCIVGRCANRISGAKFTLNNKEHKLDTNDNGVNYLHGGFDPYKNRLWKVLDHTENMIRFYLLSPDGDQGFPGKAEICVTYSLEAEGILHIEYDAVCDKDTVFNLTNHSFFNLAGHDKPEKCMDQVLSMPARRFTAVDDLSIPTGEMQPVDGTMMDFRVPKPIGRDLNENDPIVAAQGGYDHNWEIFCNPGVILSDPESGRMMGVYTDCPGVQFYSGNYLNNDLGKDGVVYCRRGGIALETQFWPDAINHPQWKQPVTKAGERYHTVTEYRFN